jgi:acetyl esterase/lipase
MRFLVLCSLWLATAVLSAAEPPVLRLWPGQPPGDESFQPPGPPTKAGPPRSADTLRLTLVTEPTLTVYRAPAGRANGAAVVICPGGGYNLLAWDKEGTEVAQWLNSLGVTAAVLQYRVPRRDPVNPHTAPLQDAQRALRLVRQHAGDWGVDVKRVGILGFSAGGHLAVMAGTHWDQTTYAKLDAADDLSCRPDFLIPIYPAYLGDENKPGPLSPLVRVTQETPPTFLVVTQDDKLRGLNAASFYIELQKAKVPAELHIYTQGGHGYGLRPSEHPVSRWPERCADWLCAMKIIPAAKP